MASKSTDNVHDVIANFGLCRSRGHSWGDDVLRFWERKRKIGKRWRVTAFSEHEMCQRCKAERVRFYSIGPGYVTLDKVTRRYPDGYILKGRRLKGREAILLSLAFQYPDLEFGQK